MVTNCQNCLANIASLNLHRSSNPKPPWAFGLHRVSQFFKWIFRRSPLCNHQIFGLIFQYHYTDQLVAWNNSLQRWELLVLQLSITTTSKSRYLSYSLIFGILSKSQVEFFVSLVTNLLKNKVILSLFICCPKANCYISKFSKRFVNLCLTGVKNVRQLYFKLYASMLFFFWENDIELLIKNAENIYQGLQGSLHCCECPLTIIVVHTNVSLA